MSLLNIDSAIFLGFLLLNLGVGLFYGRGIRTLKEYAVGDRNFTTGTIAATIIATWIGAGFFSFNLSKAYSDGLPFILAVTGNGFALFFLGQFYGPRMAEFLGQSSVAESIGSIYGNRVRLISAIAAICLAAGYTGLQIKVLSGMMNWTLGIDATYATVISALVVIIYSSFGGIRSVTFTDILQFMTFGAFVPSIALMIWGSIENHEQVINVITHSEMFDISQIFSISWLFMLIWFTMPDLDPSLFQRVLMSKNIIQMRSAFRIASFACVMIILLTSWIGVLVYSINNTVEPDKVVLFILDNYSYTGLKGITMAGIAAMVMSTVDSYINSASVLFTNDVCKTLNIKIKNELLMSRVFAVFIGTFALIISLNFDNFFNLTLIANNFYIPIVTAPLTLAIFGFRSTEKSALIGITAGITAVIIWRMFYLDTGIDSIIPGLIANFSCILLSHYILRQKGGWVGIKDKSILLEIQGRRNRKIAKISEFIKNFNFGNFIERNAPKESYVYSYFAVFSIVSSFLSIHLMDREIYSANVFLVDIIEQSTLICSVLLLTYPIWPTNFKKSKIISILWVFSVIHVSVISSTILVTINNFNEVQSIIFALRIIVLVYMFFSYNKNVRAAEKAKYIDEIEHKVEERTSELEVALKAKTEFLNNMSHEVRTPITGVEGISQGLVDNWGKFNDAERLDFAKKVASNATRLRSLVGNLLDLSKFTAGKMLLDFKNMNLNESVHSMIDEVQELYLQNKPISFKFNESFSQEIVADSERISQVMRNLFVNAVKFSPADKDSTITASLEKAKLGDKDAILFKLSDEGVGVPENELEAIFDPFTQSTKTKTRAGGTGLGLSICREIIEAHGGKIWAENNKKVGASFSFIIPAQKDENNEHAFGFKPAKPKKEKPTVLFIDDEESCRITMNMILLSYNYTVITADGGIKGLEILKEKHKEIDIVLVDLMMPDMYGLDVLKAIKAEKKYANIPVILQTGTSEQKELDKAKDLGVDGYIKKPYIKDTVLQLIASKLS